MFKFINLDQTTKLRLKALEGWLAKLSDPNEDPWPDGTADESPLEDSWVVTDPTNEFNDLSDTWTDEEEVELEPEEIDYVYKGKRDANDCFHPFGTLTFDNGDVVTSEFHHGVREGNGVVQSPRNNISRLCGTYVNGKMQGRGKLVSLEFENQDGWSNFLFQITTDTSVIDCYFKDGVMHGPVRRIDMKKFREFRRQLSFVGKYRNGRPHGTCWQYTEGGGFLHGEVDPQTGTFTGPDIAFVYPDLYTCFVGRFEDGKMVSGQPGVVKAVHDQGGIMTCTFSTTSDNVSKYSLSTKTWIGDQPLVPDPYESLHVECKASGIADAGEGLYAKHDIPEGTIVAFYNGVRLPFELLGRPPEDWSTSGYKIHVNADYESGLRMDIPDKYVSLDNYRATLGHKMNHSFDSNCFEWFFEHPRFGTIPCEKTKRPVKAGEELTLDYEYDPNNCPDWFREALTTFLSNISEEQLGNLNSKYFSLISQL